MIRIGLGRDIHRIEKNNHPFVIGGVKIPFEKGMVAHSDGDVLYHAIAEALLGSLALGDLGTHFPDTSLEFKDIDSKIILEKAYDMIKEKGYHLVNLDSSVILEKPKLAPYIETIRKNIASILEVDINQISVNAQTNENMGEVGQGNAVEAIAIVLVERKDK